MPDLIPRKLKTRIRSKETKEVLRDTASFLLDWCRDNDIDKKNTIYEAIKRMDKGESARSSTPKAP